MDQARAAKVAGPDHYSAGERSRENSGAAVRLGPIDAAPIGYRSAGWTRLADEAFFVASAENSIRRSAKVD